MLEFRRLRAVLLLSLVSAGGWAILAMLVILVGRLVSGAPLLSGPLLAPFLIFAFLGLVAGAFFTLGLGIASVRGGRSASRLGGTLFGALGGGLVWVGMLLGLFEPGPTESLLNALIPGAIATGVGAIVGFAICHIAARKELPASIEHRSFPTG